MDLTLAPLTLSAGQELLVPLQQARKANRTRSRAQAKEAAAASQPATTAQAPSSGTDESLFL